jgi:hypothetical protein
MGKKEHIQNQCLMVGDEGVLLHLHAGIGQGIKLYLSNGNNKADFISRNDYGRRYSFQNMRFLIVAR